MLPRFPIGVRGFDVLELASNQHYFAFIIPLDVTHCQDLNVFALTGMGWDTPADGKTPDNNNVVWVPRVMQVGEGEQTEYYFKKYLETKMLRIWLML